MPRIVPELSVIELQVRPLLAAAASTKRRRCCVRIMAPELARLAA